MISERNIRQVIGILEQDVRKYDEPMSEKIARSYRRPFFVLVSGILSSRTKDELTEEVSRRLFGKIRKPSDLVRIRGNELSRLIYPVGFYRTKARHLKLAGEALIRDFRGRVPDSMAELLELPGVGRKIASLVLITAFHKDAICVDTHVHRIVNRWRYVRTRSPEETEMKLKEKLPRLLWQRINNILVLYGKNICKPVGPLCGQCRINRLCPSSRA
ncbi:MAG: endonuclease III [bacterium]|nr:endonuclease III [bacterium]